jgi:hypothetical protein
MNVSPQERKAFARTRPTPVRRDRREPVRDRLDGLLHGTTATSVPVNGRLYENGAHHLVVFE